MTAATRAWPNAAPGAALAGSAEFCRLVTKRAARNFYYGLRLLPERKRADMFALYAYMRLVDDITDDDEAGGAPRPAARRLADLDAWQRATDAALDGRPPAGDAGHPGAAQLWPAFGEMARRCGVPRRVFDDTIAGQRQDVEARPIENFAQLHEYCYRVAGTVGLASIHIWGFDGGEETEALAVDRGVALQLTNILRDLREDAARGRCYLPADELAAAGLSAADLARPTGGARFGAFVAEQVARAESYYARSRPLESRVAADSRPTLAAMTEIYHQLLRKVARRPERVLRGRVSLSLWTKLRIAWRATRGG